MILKLGDAEHTEKFLIEQAGQSQRKLCYTVSLFLNIFATDCPVGCNAKS